MCASKARRADREQTTLRLPVELMEQLRRQAQQAGMSFNDYVLMALNRFADQQPESCHAPAQRTRYGGG